MPQSTLLGNVHPLPDRCDYCIYLCFKLLYVICQETNLFSHHWPFLIWVIYHIPCTYVDTSWVIAAVNLANNILLSVACLEFSSIYLMHGKSWLQVWKSDGVTFQLFFVSFSLPDLSSSLLLLLLLNEVWSPHTMDTDEWREMGLLICFPLVGCPVSWWLSTLSSCSQWVALWHHLLWALLLGLEVEGLPTWSSNWPDALLLQVTWIVWNICAGGLHWCHYLLHSWLPSAFWLSRHYPFCLHVI